MFWFSKCSLVVVTETCLFYTLIHPLSTQLIEDITFSVWLMLVRMRRAGHLRRVVLNDVEGLPPPVLINRCVTELPKTILCVICFLRALNFGVSFLS